ncbi:hypothetical protein WJX79_000973 [Trebouxia sp. C0005]
MPPKAGGKAKKSKKSAKPAWMADDVWAVSQDLPALLNSFAGIKSDKPAKSDKSAKSDKAAPPGKGSKAEPLPNIPKAQAGLILWQQLLPKKAAAPREELLKLDLAGITAKCLASNVVGDMTPAAGVLSCISNHSEAARELVFSARPAVLPTLLNALSLGSPSLTAAAIGALKALALYEDSRPRVVKVTKEWNWRPLVSVLEHEDDLPQCGTNLAATDGVVIVQALIASEPAPDAVITAASRAAAAAVITRFLEAGGVPALLQVCGGRHSSPTALASAAHTLLFLLHKLPDRTLPSFASGGGVLAVAAVVRDTRRLWLEEQMLVADGVKEKVLARVQEVVQSKVIPLLVELCNGPAGPLAAIDLNSPPPPADGKKKKSKGVKAKKGKKAGKMEDGMAEAQAQAAGCLRLLSLSDLAKVDVMAAGAVRFLTPLLESKLHHARWNARQALFNLAMLPEHVNIMTRYKVPNYIHMGNMPPSHLRPLTAPPSLGHRMAKLGLTGTATGRAIATAPAGIATVYSGLGETDSSSSRRGSSIVSGKPGSNALFPSFMDMTGSGSSSAIPANPSLSHGGSVAFFPNIMNMYSSHM